MIRAILPLTLLLTATLTADADAKTWTDPGMKRAVEVADLIVRVQAPAQGSQGVARVRFRVLSTLKGHAPTTVTVGNLHDPARCKGPTFQPQEELYLILLRDRRGRLRVPTPTFGRFPIRSGSVRYATLRGTHLRLDLPQADFEAYVRLLLGALDTNGTVAWLAGLRAHLKQTGPEATGPALTRAFLALEALAAAGQTEDVGLVQRYTLLPAPYQLRISALRALTGSARHGAFDRLREAAQRDPEPAVRTAAIRCLGRVVRPAQVDQLLAMIPSASQDTIHFTGPTDPRTNAWPAPRVALLAVVSGLGKPAAVRARATVLRLVDDATTSLESLGAALNVLTKGGADVAPQLVARLGRHTDLRGRLTDAALCATLQTLTGRPLGIDPHAWKLWAKTR